MYTKAIIFLKEGDKLRTINIEGKRLITSSNSSFIQLVDENVVIFMGSIENASIQLLR